MNKLIIYTCCALCFVACRRKSEPQKTIETRTSGTTTIVVDESFSRILDTQIAVFKSDYPDVKITVLEENERKLMPKLINGEVRMAIISRMLKPNETLYYRNKQIGVYTDRFAIDGIALIVNRTSIDTLITTEEVFDIMRGKSARKLVFDNAYSSTIRYFTDSAGINNLPKTGVYTLNNNNDVIKYVANNPGYIGVVGVNWLLDNGTISQYLAKIKPIAVKKTDKKQRTNYYLPTQENLINGKYPFLRNIYIINCEGRDGLGTGFANWVTSQRGQLIVLKSGLGPHKLLPRELNIKTAN